MRISRTTRRQVGAYLALIPLLLPNVAQAASPVSATILPNGKAAFQLKGITLSPPNQYTILPIPEGKEGNNTPISEIKNRLRKVADFACTKDTTVTVDYPEGVTEESFNEALKRTCPDTPWGTGPHVNALNP